MELKTRYHYTYFIKPFVIKENKYDKYLLKLLEDKRFKLKIFEKQKDLNLYSYFQPTIRDYLFYNFNYDKEKVQKLEELNNGIKSVILSKLHCNIFEYIVDEEIQGKINEDKGIFFKINKIEVICFDTGICFLAIKTYTENTEEFADLIDFNHRFKYINSDYYKLKKYNNIKIQTDMFSNMKELSEFIDNIIGKNNRLKDANIFDQDFFVYSYACIDQKDWNQTEEFETIEDMFLKYSKVLLSGDNSNFNKSKVNKLSKLKYATFGFSKKSTTLLSSNIEINNYTTLPYEYENEYLYTLIISLYKRIFLKKLSVEYKGNRKVGEKLAKFTKEIWTKEITNSDIGTSIYKNLNEVFELEELYQEVKDKYDIIYKELGIQKNSSTNKILLAIMTISLLLNVINIIALIKKG